MVVWRVGSGRGGIRDVDSAHHEVVLVGAALRASMHTAGRLKLGRSQLKPLRMTALALQHHEREWMVISNVMNRTNAIEWRWDSVTFGKR